MFGQHQTYQFFIFDNQDFFNHALVLGIGIGAGNDSGNRGRPQGQRHTIAEKNGLVKGYYRLAAIALHRRASENGDVWLVRREERASWTGEK
jgi:hypothetical protein